MSVKRTWWRRDASPEDQVFQEIGWLRIIGAAMFVIGVFVIAFTAYGMMDDYALGVEIIVVGLLFRAVGGVWATLERIARK